jgi:hypothetical protein
MFLRLLRCVWIGQRLSMLILRPVDDESAEREDFSIFPIEGITSGNPF